jgi:DNA-directed RNA polymerase subunit RPC12/RpoP
MNAPRTRDIIGMRIVVCIICKKEFSIPPWDGRYQELKFNKQKPCVCERCSYSLQQEAITVSGISPEDLERLDRVDRAVFKK